MSVNKVILLGRLGQDPELRQTGTGKPVCKLSMATSEKWNDQFGQKQERTEWHAVIVWGKLAELCNQYLQKGRECFVEGRLQTRQWEDKEGMKRYTTEVVATTVQFIGSAPQNGQQNQQGRRQQGQQYNQGNNQRTQQNQNSQQQGNQNNNYQKNDYQVSTDANYAGDDIPF